MNSLRVNGSPFASCKHRLQRSGGIELKERLLHDCKQQQSQQRGWQRIHTAIGLTLVEANAPATAAGV
ncbi:MAG TPA: hypothetical protein V6C84_15090 [Coleofasciculaceae cyanobacterium]